jgi:hypothetical protein
LKVSLSFEPNRVVRQGARSTKKKHRIVLAPVHTFDQTLKFRIAQGQALSRGDNLSGEVMKDLCLFPAVEHFEGQLPSYGKYTALSRIAYLGTECFDASRIWQRRLDVRYEVAIADGN